MADEGKRDINPQILIEGEGKDASIVVRPTRTIVGRKSETALGESERLLAIGQNQQDIRTGTILEQAGAYINLTASKAENGEAVVDEEIIGFDKITDKLTQKGKDGGRALRLDIASMTVRVNDLDSKQAAQNWKDLNDSNKAEAVRKNNPEMGLLYNYIKEFGGDPAKLDWQIVVAYGRALTESYTSKQISKPTLKALAEASIRDKGGQEEFYQKLLIREGYADAKKDKAGNRKWRDQHEREAAFDKLLDIRQPEATVDPVRFLERQFYEQALSKRLRDMRSSAVSFLDKSGDRQKMMIGRPKNPEHFTKGFSPALVYRTVEDTTQIGKLLDRVGMGAFWRGKACIDVLYWSFYKGQLMGDSQSRSEAKDADIFAKRKEVSQTLRQYAGAVALSYMEKDQRFVEAMNVLYALNEGMTYEQKLKKLAAEYNFDIDGELPDFITDAVMFEKVFVRDALNMSRADLRIVAYHPAQIFDKELATDAEGKVYELLGKNMRLTDSPLMKMGWWDASNARFNYEAIVPDFRLFEPEKYDDQLDKIWQHCGMFLLELNDRRHDLTKKFDEKEEEISIRGEKMTALMGQTGEYQNYQNERFKKKKGEKEGFYDHRRGVFDWIKGMQAKDEEMRRNGGSGKVGWDEQLNPKIFRDLTVRKAVDIFVRFLGQDFSGDRKLVINGATIDKGANEIFYNDDLAELLNDFIANPNDPAFADHREELTNFLVMREVLRDLGRCWGFAFDLNDPDVHQRVFNNQDLTFVENYDIPASESASLINELTQAAAYEDVYAIKVTPEKILEAIEHMKHRRHGLQNYWPMFRLLRFVEMAMMRRLTEMEIASAQDLAKMIDPMGEVQLGAAEKVQKMIGAVDDLWEARNMIISEIEKIGYMEEMTFGRVDLQKRGLPGNWRDAIEAHAKRELMAEAFNWGLTRSLPLEQQAGIDDELAAGWQFVDRDKKSMFPVQSWQIPCAYRNHDGEYIVEPLSIQGVNRVQYHEHFQDLRMKSDGVIDEEYGLQQAGNLFGGARKANIILQGGARFSTGPKVHKPTKEANYFVAGQPREAMILQESVDESGQKWLKVGVEGRGEINSIGWIREGQVKITAYEAQKFSGPLREREVRHDGGRFFWRHFEGNEKKGKPDIWKWVWVEGRWYQDPRRQDLIFIPGDGFKRRWQVGTTDSINVLVKEVEAYDAAVKEATKKGLTMPPPLLFDRNMLREEFLQKQDPKTEMLLEANYPFMIFKGEEEMKGFFSGRGRMLFSLKMGNPVAATKAEGFQAGAALPGWMYRTKVGLLGDITRFGDEMLKMMRLQIRVAIYRGGLATELERHFGKVYLPDEVITKLKKTYEKAMTGEQWAEDIEIMRKLITDTPFWAVLRNKEYKIKERVGRAGKLSGTDLANGFLKVMSALLRAKLPIDALPINVPTAIVTVGALGGLSFVGGAGIARAAAIIGLTGGLASYFLGLGGVWLSRLIKPDLSRTSPFKLPGIQNFHAYVPVE